MIHGEGLEAVYQRHRALAGRVRERATELGCGLQGDGIRERSPTLTALRVPEGVDPGNLRGRVREAGIQIAVGLGGYKQSCIRIGHMGDIRMDDVDRTMDTLEAVLSSMSGS